MTADKQKSEFELAVGFAEAILSNPGRSKSSAPAIAQQAAEMATEMLSRLRAGAEPPAQPGFKAPLLTLFRGREPELDLKEGFTLEHAVQRLLNRYDYLRAEYATAVRCLKEAAERDDTYKAAIDDYQQALAKVIEIVRGDVGTMRDLKTNAPAAVKRYVEENGRTDVVSQTHNEARIRQLELDKAALKEQARLLQEQVEAAKDQCREINRQLEACLNFPEAVRVREGGGPENLLQSLAVTLSNLREGATESLAIKRVKHERFSQVSKGWTAEHDDAHRAGELVLAAVAYTLQDARHWPWRSGLRDFEASMNNMTTLRRLVVAAALLIAEIERLDRLKNGGLRHEIRQDTKQADGPLN
jgi:hypothetical protein